MFHTAAMNVSKVPFLKESNTNSPNKHSRKEEEINLRSGDSVFAAQVLSEVL